jgi:hypothetical protein
MYMAADQKQGTCVRDWWGNTASRRDPVGEGCWQLGWQFATMSVTVHKGDERHTEMSLAFSDCLAP